MAWHLEQGPYRPHRTWSPGARADLPHYLRGGRATRATGSRCAEAVASRAPPRRSEAPVAWRCS